MVRFVFRKALLFPIFVILGASTPVSLLAAAPPFTPNSRTTQSLVDQKGVVHTVWIEKSGLGMGIFYGSYNPVEGGLESAPVKLAVSDSRFRRPQIQLDAGGTLHVLWQERFLRGPNARSAEGTWVHYANFKPTQLYRTGRLNHFVMNKRPQALHPVISIAEGSSPTIVWEEGAGGFWLVRVGLSGIPSEPVQILLEGVDSHRAFPTAVTDGVGDLHLVWTESAGKKKDLLVYRVLGGKDLRALGPKRVLHSVPTSRGQRKSLGMDDSGRLTLSWAPKQSEGSFDRLQARRHHLSFHSDGLVSDLVDRHLEEVPGVSWGDSGPAALGKRVLLAPPRKRGGVQVSTPTGQGLVSFFPEETDQEMKRRILGYSCWSGAPPSPGRPNFNSHPLYVSFAFPAFSVNPICKTNKSVSHRASFPGNLEGTAFFNNNASSAADLSHHAEVRSDLCFISYSVPFTNKEETV